jgi:hypothetical protein
MESIVRIGTVAAASSFAPRRLQYPIAGRLLQKYTLNISWLFNVQKSSSMSPQIWPHLPCLSSARCCATRHLPSHKIPPAMPKRKSGTGFHAAEMKEYDA